MNEYLERLEAKVKLGLPLTYQEKTDYILSKKTVSTDPCDNCKKHSCSQCTEGDEEL